MSRAAKQLYRTQDKGHKRKGCIDCAAEGISTKRDAPYPGPRCASHDRIKRAQRKSVTREQRWISIYNITGEQYQSILDAQGGKCAICQRATGRTKALSVDHDHACCDGPTSCGECVRGLLCSPCNKFLGYIRDEIAAAQRMVEYLIYPPGRKVLDHWEV